MKRALVISTAAALLLTLTGCVTIQVNPRDGEDGEGRLAETVACASDKDVTLTEPGAAYTVTGSCREVIVEGTGITVAAEKVRELTVRGDGNAVTVSEFATLNVEGQRNVIETLDGGDAVVNGDENELYSASNLDAVNVSGQDNDVTADGFIASLDENGSGS